MDNWFTIEQIDKDTFAISEYRHWEESLILKDNIVIKPMFNERKILFLGSFGFTKVLFISIMNMWNTLLRVYLIMRESVLQVNHYDLKRGEC